MSSDSNNPESSKSVVGDEIDGDDDGSSRSDDSPNKMENKRHGSSGNFKKALSWFKNKKEERIGRRKSRGSDSSSDGTSGKRIGHGFGVFCCFKQTPTLDSSPSGSQTCDPTCPEFTYDMLRAFIESNDFYSKECNTHLEFDHIDENCEK